jgi:putative ABC transport system permease protein
MESFETSQVLTLCFAPVSTSPKGMCMNVLRRGVKNAFRNSIRSVGIIAILGVVIALAISMVIARSAVADKINQVRGTTGNTIIVSPAGFFGFQGGGTPLNTTQMDKIAAIPNVTFVRQSLQQRLDTTQTSLKSSITPGSLGRQFGGGSSGGGFAAPGGSTTTFTLPVSITGTNSPGTALVGGANGGGTEKLRSGTSFSPTSSDNVAIVGSSLATANDLKVGSTFTAWGSTITVVGIYDAGSTFADAGVLMPLATVQKLASATGQVTSATVIVNSVDNVASVSAQIKNELGSAADVTSTQQTVETQLAPLNSVKTIATSTLIGAVIAAALILLLSMLMIVRERRREIGVLKAIGAPNSSVIGQFIAESVTFTVLGSIVGLILGIVLSEPITNALVSSNTSTASTGFAGGPGGGGFFHGGPSGAAAPPQGGGSFHFGGFHSFTSTVSQVHAAASVSTFIFAFLAALVIAVLGSTVAVANIVRIRPAEVLRSE